jgi:hypothetical protein
MKLTKGKLSKLFHKKKQTMRRYKNQRKYRRASKTFRQKKPLNLHRSSMKKFVDPRKIEWIGGTDPDEKVPLVVKPASDEATITTSETITEPVPEPMSEPVPEEPVAEEPVAEEPVAEEPVPEPISEPVAEEPVPEPVAEEPVSEPISEPIAEEPVAKPLEEPAVAENVKPESSSVADALDIIANKIAKAVVKEMRENPATGSSPNQDADIAVPLAVDALVKQTQLAPE